MVEKFSFLVINAHWNNYGDEEALKAMLDESLFLERLDINLQILSNVVCQFYYEGKGIHMLHADINVYYIKEFPGHSDLSTTERYYVRADTEMKRKALAKMTSSTIPDALGEMPAWKKDSDLLAWLKSLG